MALKLLLCFLVVSMVSSKPEYMQRIPNAAKVPDPFNMQAGKFWNGVGHRVAAGDGARNPFGVAFEAAGENWTAEFCRADTDEDGKMNGEELGDPNCVWMQGETPARTTDITHPGVCEPITSDKCKEVNNKWLGQCGGEGANSSEECDGGTTGLTAPITLIVSSLAIITIKKFFM